ncbi:hypothetical protein [Zunongwangia endophytica]|uniref:Uncharacterized protein n=1 Tax=Zunongwangia endophytica TaxID=1808945 RepID=A0ABV8HE48_9FLAO|nr:hypothetical protein [Zunongwangia endophytica]MDN3593461.1 hypothetical protein [Zunongwangia endophytica]
MALTKVLLTVNTYPLPSRSYDELVCTAGILEDGSWIRIYPVPLSFLLGQRKSGKMSSFKYNWIEIDLERRTDDFRPESYSPKNYDFKDLKVIKRLDTKSNWYLRKQYCLQNVYKNFDELILECREPKYKSLATFKPTEIIGIEFQKDDPEWKNEWKELRKQGDLFSQDKKPEILIPKLPFKFYYKFKDVTGKIRRLMIEDWEIGALYWKSLSFYEGNVSLALDAVKNKYETEFIKKNDIYFFVGTTKQWHMRKAHNPFVIIGVFYPLKENQLSLF